MDETKEDRYKSFISISSLKGLKVSANYYLKNTFQSPNSSKLIILVMPLIQHLYIWLHTPMLTMLTCYNFCFPVSTKLLMSIRPLFNFFSAVYTTPYSFFVYLSTPLIHLLISCLYRALFIICIPVYAQYKFYSEHLSTPLSYLLYTLLIHLFYTCLFIACLRPWFTYFTLVNAPS